MPWIFPNFQIFKLFAKLQATCFDLLLCFTFHNQKQIGTFLHQITQPRNYIFQNFIYAKRCVNVENENVIKVWENKQELAQDLGWEEQCHL